MDPAWAAWRDFHDYHCRLTAVVAVAAAVVAAVAMTAEFVAPVVVAEFVSVFACSRPFLLGHRQLGIHVWGTE